MRSRLLAAAVLTAAALSSSAGSANAALVQPYSVTATATNGIAYGADGNFWVAEAYNDSVVRISPSGTVVGQSIPLGGAPTSIAAGPGGRIWVAVTGADKLAVLDTTQATPTPTFIGTPSNCGPVGIVDGGDGRMYFSMPNDGAVGCTNPSRIGAVPAGGGAPTSVDVPGEVFDLAVSGGKLFAPDFENDAIRRYALGATPVFETALAAAGSPDGITVDPNGILWATAYGTGQVFRFAPTAAAVTAITPAAPALQGAFGIAAAPDGRIYVLGADSRQVLRLNNDGTGAVAVGTPAGSQPWQIVNGPDGDLFFTDLMAARIFRYVNAAPRPVTGAASASSSVSAAVQGSVDPRGNDTQVVFDYGTTTAYGQTAGAPALPGTAAPIPVTGVLTGLTPGTTYHVRVRATNGEGTVAGADTTFTTAAGIVDADKDGVSPPVDCNDANPAIKPGAVDKPGDKVDQDCSGKDATFPELNAAAAFTYNYGTTTTIRVLELSRLRGGETATVKCTGSKRCPFKTKTYKGLKKGKKTIGRSLWKGRKLPSGTVISVRVTRSGYVGTSTVLTVRKKKRPKIARACVKPGATKTSACA